MNSQDHAIGLLAAEPRSRRLRKLGGRLQLSLPPETRREENETMHFSLLAKTNNVIVELLGEA